MVLQRTVEQNFNLIKDTFSGFIVRPLNAFGLGGFIFDIDKETIISLDADITDHFVEDNSAVQDHMAVRPLILTLTGFVGEITFQRFDPNNETISQVTQKLTTLSGFLPQLADAAEQAKGIIEADQLDLEQTVNTAVDLWTLTRNLNPSATLQQQAYLYFKSLWEQKILVSVQTPFEFINNLLIENITATQDEETEFISDFSIRLKQIRTVETITVPVDPDRNQGRRAEQDSEEVDKGKAQGRLGSLALQTYEFLRG